MHIQEFGFGFIGIGDETAVEGFGGAGDGGDGRGDEAAGTAFGGD